MATIRTILLWSLGVVVGFGVAVWWLERAPAAKPVIQSVEAPAPAPDHIPVIESAIVKITSHSANNSLGATANGILVSDDIIIAAASAIAGAGRVNVETLYGDSTQVEAVLATDDIYGVVALKLKMPIDHARQLTPEEGAGSLQPGRNVAFLSRAGTVSAEVISAAKRDALGAYYYAVREKGRRNGVALAIIDPETGKLLGMLRDTLVEDRPDEDWKSELSMEAIDVEPLHGLVDATRNTAPFSLAQFTNHYYNDTTPGRIALLRSLVLSAQHDAAIEHGKAIVNLDTYSQTYGPPLLRQAYLNATQELIDGRRYREALSLLNDSVTVLTDNDELLMLRAQSLEALSEYEQALQVMLAMQRPDFNRIRIMLLERALVTGSGDDNIRLIELALATDPDFAPYYRLLGEHQAANGEMIAAVANLERAVTLEPAMARELAPLLQRLRARRYSAPLAEIPIRRYGDTMIVDVRINGSSEPLRFILDTGASYTAIRVETALRLGVRDVFFGAPVVELQTANGTVYTTTTTLDSIEVAGARVDNVETVLLESMGRWDGLLGQSFLRHFDIEIDRTRNVIAFNRRLSE